MRDKGVGRLFTLLKGFSNFSIRFIYALYGIFAAVLIFTYFTDIKKDNYIILLLGFLILCTLGTFILRKSSLYLKKLNEKKCFIILLLTCFVVKITWICLYKIEPFVDYATFYNTAEALSANFQIESRYVALFPHIFGYSLFLSVFFEIFGTSYIIPPIVNVILTTISMALIYFIGKKIDGIRTATMASILWILLPSQTIYNMLALSEPLYCTELLLIWIIMIIIDEKLSKIGMVNLIFYSLLLSLLLALMNMVRQIAAVPIIALIVWVFVIDIKHLGHKNILFKKIAYIATVLAGYFLFSLVVHNYTTARLGEEVAKTPGHNMYVGFNKESFGTWNEEDSKLLMYYSEKEGWTANDVQEQMLEDTKDRLKNDNIDFAKLFFDKFIIFLGHDRSAVLYASSVLDHPLRYMIICDIFYYFLIVISLLGVFIAFKDKDKDKSAVLFICLYAIGLTMAQMLVEVAGRYHYSVTISMVILAALGMNHLYKHSNAR